ncbi:hypothetical protein AVEN_69305-1 [Araneus ventricosus]|uniref:Uncharacterized protein n=1 Tax=Araneus ventricosus TaxID=182803 RepID=A0A4Y2RUI3_ARAVE|nr:hypothetical protein AVEN_267896-1 [Araneus ventricosus]GBN79448.1 hypothetical protein AVEN_69305-1 [Araneus ventricosus]
MCAVLAHLPIEDIVDGWLCIMEDSPENEKLQRFYDHFLNQWMENSVITIDMWNCLKKLHSTNNAVEGWYNKLYRLMNKPHPKIKSLVKRLKEEAEFNSFLKKRHVLKLEKKPRLKKYNNLNKRINKILDDYCKAPSRDSETIRKCLKALAFVGKFE